MTKFICLVSLVMSLSLGVGALNSVKVLNKAAEGMQRINLWLGTFSRSKTVSSVSRSLREEDNAQVRESLTQAIVTLVVLDVGGGALAPFASHLIDVLIKDRHFHHTRKAFKTFGTHMIGWVENLDPLSESNSLKDWKDNIVRKFESDVANLPRDHVARKHLRKAKRWLKVRTLGKVLGPLFDVATVGVNAWALQTAVRDCVKTPNVCNRGSIAAASLSIASGLVGLGTFVVLFKATAVAAMYISPIGALVAAALGITATLIELFYTPSPDPVAIQNSLKEAAMKKLDVYSRIQLNHANMILAENKVERGDLYVVNQGHLPKWFNYRHQLLVKFGKRKNNRPRKIVTMQQPCNSPKWGVAKRPQLPSRPLICPYLADGKEITSTLNNSQKLGFSFYGFTPNVREDLKAGSSISPNDDNSPYRGSIVLVPTNKVQPNILSEEGLSANLRGLNLDTGKKSGDNASHDDLIALGDMPSLDADEVIKIRMGKGNDALNIDGRLGSFSRRNVLDAKLGLPGDNTLNFDGMADNYGITGIVFDATTGMLQFKHGSSSSQLVGTVKNAKILGASPFNDEITLYGDKTHPDGFDFIVLKFKGQATYKVDIAHLARQSTVKDFKIIDTTEGVDGCVGHRPVLKLVNFANGANSNDIIYKHGRILVSGERTGKRKRRDFEGVSNGGKKRRFTEERRSQCSGETARKPGFKEDLATIVLHSKCPVSIEATNRDGSCMMSPRTKSEIDVTFFRGSRLLIDFNQRSYKGSRKGDYALLKCPSSTVSQATTIDLSEDANDVLILSSELFLDPCGIDESNGALRLERLDGPHLTWELQLPENGLRKFSGPGRTITILGVEEILNEHGDSVLDLRKKLSGVDDLYQLYAISTMGSIGAIIERDRSQGVKNDLLSCLNLESSITPEEQELCET